MKWTVGSKIAAGFSLALVVFVLGGITSYSGTASLIEAFEARRASYETRDSLADTRLALRDIGSTMRTFLLTGSDAHYDALQSAKRAVDKPLADLRARVASSRVQTQRVERTATMLKEYVAAVDGLVGIRRAQGVAAATEAFQADRTRQVLAGLATALGELQTGLESALDQHVLQSDEEARAARWMIVAGNVAGIVLASLVGWLLARDISGPLRKLTAGAERITTGDLSADVSVGRRNDEIGMLARALERMTQSLRAMAAAAHQIAAGDLRNGVQPQSEADALGQAFARMSNDLRNQLRELLEGVSVLSAAASQIVASSSQLAASATQSAAAVSETTTTVEEVRHTAQLTSQKARLVADSAQRTAQVTENGRRATQEVESGMARIRSQMDHIAAGMVQLSERTQAVGQVIAAVEDLSTQSNMLAVNAAIEAAKAGEHGRGFSVVAQEVKSLSEQSRQATNQVRNILGDIQKATAAAVMATEEGSKVVDAGARQAETAGEAVSLLGSSATDAAQAALQIAASSQQQLVGMDQVASAMDSIKQASSQNVAGASQLESTARNLSELGQRLKQMVAGYKV